MNMIFLAALFMLYVPLSSEESVILQIPLKHSNTKFMDAEMENSYASTSQRELQVDVNYNLHGMLGMGYYIELAIGQPEQLINVLIDTGSSNFAVAAAPDLGTETFFNVSSSQTFENLSTYIHVPYTQGSWSGLLGTDVIKISSLPSLHPFRANVALITEASDFFVNGSNWDGILGLGFSEIARPNGDLMPFFDSLMSQLSDVDDIFSLQLCGAGSGPYSKSSNLMDGLMVIGGVDSSLYIGELLYVPLRREWYFEVIITDIMIDDVSLGLDCKEYNYDKTIVDSGTTVLHLPRRVYDATLRSLILHTSEPYPDTFWNGIELLCWSRDHSGFYSFPTMTLSLAASANETVHLILSPQRYLRRVSDRERHNGGFNTDPLVDCFRMSLAPSESGTVIGAVVMEGFYVVFDRQSQRIGFAQTSCNISSQSDNVESRVEGYFYSHDDAEDCGYVRLLDHQVVAATAAYVVLAVCSVCLLLIFFTYLYRRGVRARICCHRHNTGSDDSSLLNRP